MPNPLGNVIRPARERFIANTRDAESGCIEWTGGLNGVGYGQFYAGKTSSNRTGKTYAHRWSYEQYVGPIPEGMHIDHLCRNRKCVNPAHLEPVTPGENVLRGNGRSATNARKTHCPSGHKYAGSNLYMTPSGQRKCRECNRIRCSQRSA